MPSSNRNFGLQPSSSLIFVASIAYRLSWPGRSGTNEIRSSDFLRDCKSIFVISKLEYSLLPSIAIERNSLVLWNLWYKKWDEGNEILIRSIIIRTTSNSIVDSKCPTISLNKNISSSLRCRIWARWFDVSLFSKKPTLRYITIYFISWNIVKSLKSKFPMKI